MTAESTLIEMIALAIRKAVYPNRPFTQNESELCARSALTALRNEGLMVEWQDISTAPKDGSRVIIFTPNQEIPGGYQYEHLGESYWIAEDNRWAGFNRYINHTHWTPLPKRSEVNAD